MPANDQLESSIVLVLISLFVAIIGQGLFLAVSVGALHSQPWICCFPDIEVNACLICALYAGLSA